MDRSKEELEAFGRNLEEAIRGLEEVKTKKDFSFYGCLPLPADGPLSSEEFVVTAPAERSRPKTSRPPTVEEQLALLDQLRSAGQIDDEEYRLLKDKILKEQ